MITDLKTLNQTIENITLNNFFPTNIRNFFRSKLKNTVYTTLYKEELEVKYDDRLDAFFIFVDHTVATGIIFNNESLTVEIFPVNYKKEILTPAYTALNIFLSTYIKRK